MDKKELSPTTKKVLKTLINDMDSSFSRQENLEHKAFSAIRDILFEKVLLRHEHSEQISQAKKQERASFDIAESLKEISDAQRNLTKIKCPLTTKSISEMIESILSDSFEGGFVAIARSEHLEGTDEEKQATIDQLDLSQLANDTLALITKHLKKKGYFKKKKGFG